LKVKDPEVVSTRFLYFLLRTQAKKYVSAGMGNPKLMAGDMGNIRVKLPTISKQNEIVAVLDNFDSLLNDLSIGLPAELNARRQQYEYYRDSLLRLDEAA
jgi:type I restriction enzyme S subunit